MQLTKAELTMAEGEFVKVFPMLSKRAMPSRSRSTTEGDIAASTRHTLMIHSKENTLMGLRGMIANCEGTLTQEHNFAPSVEYEVIIDGNQRKTVMDMVINIRTGESPDRVDYSTSQDQGVTEFISEFIVKFCTITLDSYPLTFI